MKWRSFIKVLFSKEGWVYWVLDCAPLRVKCEVSVYQMCIFLSQIEIINDKTWIFLWKILLATVCFVFLSMNSDNLMLSTWDTKCTLLVLPPCPGDPYLVMHYVKKCSWGSSTTAVALELLAVKKPLNIQQYLKIFLFFLPWIFAVFKGQPFSWGLWFFVRLRN